MKLIFNKNYKVLKILIIFILAVMLVSMLAAWGSFSENKASANALTIAETVGLSAEDNTSISAFKKAVSKLPDDADKLEYNHKSLLEDAKKKYNDLSDDAKQEVAGSKEEIKYKELHKEFSSKFMMIESLITLGKGMLGIFIVMGIIIGVIYLLNRAGKGKNKIKAKVEL